MLGCIEQVLKQEPRSKLEDEKSDDHDRYGYHDTKFRCLGNPFLIPCTIVVGNDRDHSVVHTEDWHEDKTLKFKVYAEYCCSGRREHEQDLVHSKCHDRTDGLHDDGRKPDLVDNENRSLVRAKMPEAHIDLFVLCMVEIEREAYSYDLTGDGGNCRPCNFKPGETEQSEDHDRIQYNVDDGSKPLCDHIVKGPSSRLKKPFQCDLQEDTGAEYSDDGHILCPIRYDHRVICLKCKEQPGTQRTEHCEDDTAYDRKEQAIPGCPVGAFVIFLS